MDNNFNIDKNTMDKLNSMMKNGDVSKLISQIPPEMMENFSSLMNNNNSTNNTQNSITNSNINNNTNSSTNSNTNSNNSNNSFDFSNIDMNTILKMQSIMSKMNNSNDPRSNLLQSLKPYLREERKAKVDQYANLLNVAKIAELFNNTNQNNDNKGENSK